MKYIPRIVGAKLGLFDEYGSSPRLPKGIKIRFDTINTPASFQFFDGKKAISPIMVQLEADRGMRYIATLKSGVKEVINLEKQTIGREFSEKIENIYIGLDGEVLFDIESGKAEPYVLDKKRFKTPFTNGYLLTSLVGVKDSSGKCAILDSYTKKLITGFVLDPKNYGFVGALNLETNTKFNSYYVIQTNPDEKETKNKHAQKFIIVSDEGQFVAELISQKYLWNVTHAEKQPDGSEKQFSYVAFAEVDEKTGFKTKVLKVDIELGKVAGAFEVPLIASHEIQNNGLFIFAPDDRLVLITENPEIEASKGAYIIDTDCKPEQILKNINTEIKYTHHYSKGKFLTYKNAETVGKIALNEKARTFEVSKTEFFDLAKKYFGVSTPSELRPKLQQIEVSDKKNGKKGPNGGTGPNGGEGPTGFGG